MPAPTAPEHASGMLKHGESGDAQQQIDAPGQRPRHRAGQAQGQLDAFGRGDLARGIEHVTEQEQDAVRRVPHG